MPTAAAVRRVIVGTAGHIDHGKTTLVEKLTGIRTDRLPEEQERGMTLDVGYAEFRLPDGTEVGLLDVPGHEKLVRTMVAGATAMDLALLVVAADDGPMLQTREHVDVLDLLGVRRVIVVMTKTDLVDGDHQDLVEAEARAGHRAALALADVSAEAVKRGMVVAAAGALTPCARFAARLRVLSRVAEPLTHGMRVRIHVGSDQAGARLHLLEGDSLAP